MKRKSETLKEVEAQVDFGGVNQKLAELARSGELQRKTTLGKLLDKVRPALIEARENRVSFIAITQFLNSSGIPVSETTLRQYLHAQMGKKKPSNRRKTTATAPESPQKPQAVVGSKPEPVASPPAAPTQPGVNPVTGKKLAPRLSRYRPA